MSDVNLVAILAAVLGSGGLGAVITTIVNSIRAARRGVAVREDQRKEDIIRARDDAIHAAERARLEADAADERADQERLRRIHWQEHAARQRIRLITAGLEPDPWPDEDTGPPPQRRDT